MREGDRGQADLPAGEGIPRIVFAQKVLTCSFLRFRIIENRETASCCPVRKCS